MGSITAAFARASYADAIAAVGETVTLRRGTTAPFTDADARARVRGYEPQELIGTITVGDREIIVLAADLEAAGWPVPPKTTDKVIVRGKQLSIKAADDSTVRVAGVIVAYLLTASG